MTKALIVGGGIGGLATAWVLSRQGIDVDLIERNAEVRALGSGITLIGPSLRALSRLGVLDECLTEGFGCSEMLVCTPTLSPLSCRAGRRPQTTSAVVAHHANGDPSRRYRGEVVSNVCEW
ncbi:FAD-dependent oxidoreductase [Nocardia beijingensis]|uniref:FAD-dependent oxidoreductase n=1 Tax=Nocardia beijingensis TaxID=95162 RepID=UPI00344B119E